MKRFQRLVIGLRLIIVLQIMIFLLIPIGVIANAHPEIVQTIDPEEALSIAIAEPVNDVQSEISAQTAISPTLEVEILGTLYAPYDFNTLVAPEVFVLHAQVVNTGTVTAENVTLTMDFTDDGGTGWALLNGEVEERTMPELLPSDTFNGYWFAVYPLQAGETHQYTVTVTADDVDPIMAVGTAEVVGPLDTSNIFQVSMEQDVDTSGDITMTVTYDLGKNPLGTSFNPVGNTDFLPGNYRLLNTEVEFFDESENPVDSFMNKIFFPSLKPVYETATVSYMFSALSPTNVRLCPYNIVETLNYKYDKDYCTGGSSLEVSQITGTVFHDQNGNGLIDTGEAGIEGVTITLDDLYTTTTDIVGAYTFSTIVTGTHTVVETDLAGYFSTTPNEVHPFVTRGDTFQVDFGDAVSSVDEFASINGTVFHDINSNQIWDNSELGIPGVKVTLDGLESVTTNIYGSYTFSTTLTGDHIVLETDLPKYLSTTPNTVAVYSVVLGEDYLVNFGDKYLEFGLFLPLILR